MLKNDQDKHKAEILLIKLPSISRAIGQWDMVRRRCRRTDTPRCMEANDNMTKLINQEQDLIYELRQLLFY